MSKSLLNEYLTSKKENGYKKLKEQAEQLESMSPLQELKEIAGDLPLNAYIDINMRISDWLASGGKEDDPYIKRQVEFAKKCIQARKEWNSKQH